MILIFYVVQQNSVHATSWKVWARSIGNSCAVITVALVSFYPDGYQEKCGTGLTGIWAIFARGNDSAVFLSFSVFGFVEIEPTNDDSLSPSLGQPNLSERRKFSHAPWQSYPFLSQL